MAASELMELEPQVAESRPTPTRPHWSWHLWVALTATLFGFGVFCFLYQTQHNFVVTGLRNIGRGGSAWGLYVAFDVVFVGISFAGITVAALARLFQIKTLKPVTRLAELVTIVALLAGGCVIVADLGRPLVGLLNLPKFARPASPFYGTFTLVIAGYLFSSFVFFFLSARHDAWLMTRWGHPMLRWFYRLWATGYRDSLAERQRHHSVSFWLSLSILPLLVTAHSTLGFIFGLQAGRPGWYSALQAPGFVILAGVSGTGMVILAAIALRKLFRLEKELPTESIRWLGNLMWVLMLVYLYLMVVEELTAGYAGPAADRMIAHALVSGDYSPLFWTTVSCFFLTFALPFALYLGKRTSLPLLAVAAIAANVGAILKRVLIVVPSQTHGALLPIEPGRYRPSWVEYGIIAGLFGMIFLAVLLFARIFPVVPGQPLSPPAPSIARRSQRLRKSATSLWALGAIAAIVFGLTDSFRLFSGGELDPLVPFSPIIFAGGLMALFSSAIVFETFPERRSRRLSQEAVRAPVSAAPAPVTRRQNVPAPAQLRAARGVRAGGSRGRFARPGRKPRRS